MHINEHKDIMLQVLGDFEPKYIDPNADLIDLGIDRFLKSINFKVDFITVQDVSG